MASNFEFDAVVIGGGPGGSSAAKTLAKSGKKVALVSNELGGECLNYGCIPTKTYLWTTELFEKISQADVFGIDISSAQINWQRMRERRIEVVSKLKKALQFSLEKANVKIIKGTGEIIDPHTVKVTPSAILNTQYIILATGSQPTFPPSFQPDGQRILTNHEIINLQQPPKSLLIIGGGASGVEFASIFSVFGIKITIAEKQDRLLAFADHEVSAELERVFARKNIEILKNIEITPEQTKNYEKVLIALGRKPVSNVKVNEKMQTEMPNIFAIGDTAGKCMLAYSAEREGEIAANTILGKAMQPLNYELIPYTIFSIPEIAMVGLTENEAKKRGIDYIIGKSPYSANSKALITAGRDGFAKIIIEKSSGKLLGVHIIGEKASEIIAEASLALNLNLDIENFANNLHGHPVLSEVVKGACNMLK